MVHPIPRQRGYTRLEIIDSLQEVSVESKEVRQFTDGIDFSLKDRFGMSEHRGRVHDMPVRSGEQVGRLKEDRRTVFPWHVLPRFLGLDGRIHGPSDFIGATLVIESEVQLVIVGSVDRDLFVGFNLLPAND